MSSSYPLATSLATQDDLVVTIPNYLQYGETCGFWSIRHGVAKLQRKYSEVLDSLEFDGYAAARAVQTPSWRNRVEYADLLMTRLMQSRIEQRRGAIEAVIRRSPKIETALARVPDDLALEQDIPDRTWEQLRSLFEAFRVKGVALATMTKLLWMKRPALIPMMDSHVRRFLFKAEWPKEGRRRLQPESAAGVRCIKQFRELMRFGQNLKVLVTIRDELSRWLAGRTASSGVTPTLSLVRVLDSLLWYDWAGHQHFGVGVLENGLSTQALVSLLRHADHAIRWRTAQALGKAGPFALEAIPALVEVWNNKREDSLVQWWAGDALKKIDSKVAAQVGVV